MTLHFIRPLWFFALIPLSIFVFYCYKNYRQKSAWRQVIDPELLSHVLPEKLAVHSNKFFWYILLGWFITVFALAGPAFSQKPQPVYESTHAKVIVLDLSRSMLANDIPPDRLTRAKYKVLDILNNYAQGRTGLVVFAKEAYTVSPLTFDTHTIALMVPDLNPDIMPVQGHNIAAGLMKAEQLLIQGDAKTGNIILITDSNPSRQALSIARNISQKNYPISVLAVGTSANASIPMKDSSTDFNKTAALRKLDIVNLQTLAHNGGGKFSLFTNNDSDINGLLAHDFSHSPVQALKTKLNTHRWNDSGRWFILLVLPFMLILFRKHYLERTFS